MKNFFLLTLLLAVTLTVSAQTSGHFTMEVKSFRNDQPNPKKDAVMEYHFNGREVAFVIPDEKNKTTMILNPETRVTTTLIDDGKTKSGTKMKLPAGLMAKDDQMSNYTLTPTDETKDINGFSCRKYLFENKDYSGYIWITSDIAWGYAETAKQFGKMIGSKNTSWIKIDNDFKGFPILAYQKEKNGKESFQTTYKNIEVGKYNTALFETTGYEVMDMTQFQR